MKPARTELHGSIEGRYMDFLPITDLEESVRQDVRRLREPLIPKNLLIHGLIYDVNTGKLEIVDLLEKKEI